MCLAAGQLPFSRSCHSGGSHWAGIVSSTLLFGIEPVYRVPSTNRKGLHSLPESCWSSVDTLWTVDNRLLQRTPGHHLEVQRVDTGDCVSA